MVRVRVRVTHVQQRLFQSPCGAVCLRCNRVRARVRVRVAHTYAHSHTHAHIR